MAGTWAPFITSERKAVCLKACYQNPILCGLVPTSMQSHWGASTQCPDRQYMQQHQTRSSPLLSQKGVALPQTVVEGYPPLVTWPAGKSALVSQA